LKGWTQGGNFFGSGITGLFVGIYQDFAFTTSNSYRGNFGTEQVLFNRGIGTTQ